jgi:hypothetical protein
LGTLDSEKYFKEIEVSLSLLLQNAFRIFIDFNIGISRAYFEFVCTVPSPSGRSVQSPLPLGERVRVRGSTANKVKSPQSPHPSPLPEGEGATFPSPCPKDLPEGEGTVQINS